MSFADRSLLLVSHLAGLVYAILGMGFIPVAIFRYRMAVSNAQRFVAMEVVEPRQDPSSTQNATSEHSPTTTADRTLSEETHEAQHSGTQAASDGPIPAPVRTVLRESFVTAGSVVAAATVFVGLVEIALLVLILRV